MGALLIMVLSLLTLCRVFGFGFNGDEQVHVVENREFEGGVAKAEFQRRSTQISGCEQCFLTVQQILAVVPLVLFVLGCIWQISSTDCDEALSDWVQGVLIFKPLVIVFACCCGPCIGG